jgi:SPP1 family predicted phage head-tail adaptor
MRSLRANMILNGRVINPGEMRTQITLESRTVTTQTGGFETPAWSTIATVWSKWTNAHGSEAVQAAMLNAEAPATVLIRYRSGLDTTCAISKGGVRYEITSIDNIQERNEYIEMKVKRMKPG